jgi:hypothetical protein
MGGGLISRGHLYKILSNPIYVGRLSHKGMVYDGQHAAIIDAEMWDRVQRHLQVIRKAGGLPCVPPRRSLPASSTMIEALG